MPKQKVKKKVSAKWIFDKHIAKTLLGETSEKTIDIFSDLTRGNFYDLSKKFKLTERQLSSLIGFKDECVVEIIVSQIIKENNLQDTFYCKKVTANEKSGLSARKVNYDGKDKVLTIGGDCVIFRKPDNKPLMIIECKEYIDMIRMKELVGESHLIKDTISTSTNLLSDIKFCVFANVLELTGGWGEFLNRSDLKRNIDEIFIIREGKRRDRENKPVKENLMRFKRYIEHFLVYFK